MARRIFELQGYAIVLKRVAFVTRVFEAGGGEGWQFNVGFGGDARLKLKYATRSDAELQRSLLLKALQEG